MFDDVAHFINLVTLKLWALYKFAVSVCFRHYGIGQFYKEASPENVHKALNRTQGVCSSTGHILTEDHIGKATV